MDDVEKFEITDWDIENEFNPNRVKHRQTKQQQIYGIWADEDSDDNERPSFRSKGKHDMTAPISFISGGVKQAGQPDVKQENSDEDSKSFLVKCVLRHFMLCYREIGDWERHTRGIGQKLLLQMGYQPGKGLGKELQGIAAPIEAKQRKGKGAIGCYGPEHKQAPIKLTSMASDEEVEEEVKRPRQWKKSGGDKPKVKFNYRTLDEVTAEGAMKNQRGDSSQLSRVKVIDMTGPEQRILSGYHQIHQQHTKPEEKEEPVDTRKGRGHHFSLPELTHNLDLLVNIVEQTILNNDRELKREQDRVINLEHEEERLAKVIQEEKKHIDSLKTVLEEIERLHARTEMGCENPMTLEEVIEVFENLQENYYEEYRMYNLTDLTITIVFPLMKRYMSSWNPFKDSKYGMDVFKKWKDLLELEKGMRFNQCPALNDEMDPYHQLMWHVWMPCLRTAIFSWIVRQCDPLIDLLENWLPLLPTWMTTNILEQMILPRLQKEVDTWDPLTDTMPIHSWIHPWLPLMGDRLEPLYAPIRHKLANALKNWHPSDCSAKLILEPWRKVFSLGTMQAFVVTNILPKLAMVLQNFIINPHQQHLDIWQWVMAWEDLLPVASLANLLQKHFFPQWLQVLCAWLNHNPNYDEVTKWYTGWKSMFSEALLNDPVIKDQFKKALDIMNRAVSATQGMMSFQPGARESVSYLTNVERQQGLDVSGSTIRSKKDYESISSSIRASSSSVAALAMSFKDLIEKKALEKNI
ncbi:tuftelin-interacting protein 11-like, partial [Limulus polyphemus]|uniref:Tuftelin-interacting protein 11-like n=1 Tax=Limulus polyphemus TaxID=6850 RepID=A0ABM1TNG3_LIMPO